MSVAEIERPLIFCCPPNRLPHKSGGGCTWLHRQSEKGPCRLSEKHERWVLSASARSRWPRGCSVILVDMACCPLTVWSCNQMLARCWDLWPSSLTWPRTQLLTAALLHTWHPLTMPTVRNIFLAIFLTLYFKKKCVYCPHHMLICKPLVFKYMLEFSYSVHKWCRSMTDD